jgi:hypothetical protein
VWLSADIGGSEPMRSQLRFVMHPRDEAVLMAELLRDPAVLLVNGPRWKSAVPPTTRNVSTVGSYCIIWSTEDLPELAAHFIPGCNDWYCRAEYATIQFLRCSITETVITEGRLAISTDPGAIETAANVERRYKLLCRAIKATYLSSVVRWHNPDFPEAPAGPSRSANPSAPDPSLWVGPAAISWLASDAGRRIKNFPASPVEGTVSEKSREVGARVRKRR